MSDAYPDKLYKLSPFKPFWIFCLQPVQKIIFCHKLKI